MGAAQSVSGVRRGIHWRGFMVRNARCEMPDAGAVGKWLKDCVQSDYREWTPIFLRCVAEPSGQPEPPMTWVLKS